MFLRLEGVTLTAETSQKPIFVRLVRQTSSWVQVLYEVLSDL